MPLFDPLDLAAITVFGLAWASYAIAMEWTRIGRLNLNARMDDVRAEWMRRMLSREVRIVDAQIMAALQNGAAFFASTSLIALGGAFTLLNQTDRMLQIFQDLPFHSIGTKGMLEMKIVGLVGIYGYAFFKFGWSYRLFNYSAILIGAVPIPRSVDAASMDAAIRRAAEMQIDAGHHFHWGLRALFFSVGFFGWFVNAWVFILSTTLVLGVLARRQYHSRARTALLAAEPPVYLDTSARRDADVSADRGPLDQGVGQKDEDRPVSQ